MNHIHEYTYYFNTLKSFYQVLFDTSNRFSHEELYINASEEVFADALTTVSKEFPNVIFGSYPEEAR